MFSDTSNFPHLSSIQPERHRNGALSIHPYFGRFDPALARTLIEEFSKEGDIVLDPFCGSGTVLHEGLLSGRSVIGWDSSPIATLIATAKVLGINEAELEKIGEIKQEFEQYSSLAPLFQKPIVECQKIPEMPRIRDISYWFEQNAIKELCFIKSYLDNIKNCPPALNILLTVAFSKIIVPASNQQGESTYRRIEKQDYPGRVVDLFLGALEHVTNTALMFNGLMLNNHPKFNRRLVASTLTFSQILWGDYKAKIFLQDTRRIPRENCSSNSIVDLVVTSPPYLMSWDYGLYHKFRFYWLGLDLDGYEQTEIGRHLRRRKDDVEHYQSDMLRAFKAISEVMNKVGYLTLVNSPSVVHGKQVDTNSILVECGHKTGWQLIENVPSVDIPGPHHGMYASLKARKTGTAGKSGKKEHVLIFRRKQF